MSGIPISVSSGSPTFNTLGLIGYHVSSHEAVSIVFGWFLPSSAITSVEIVSVTLGLPLPFVTVSVVLTVFFKPSSTCSYIVSTVL